MAPTEMHYKREYTWNYIYFFEFHGFLLIHIQGIHEKGSEMSSQLFVTLYTLSIHPSAHKQLR